MRAPPARSLMGPSYILRMRSIRTLLHEIIDYAGLFPPAGLEMGRRSPEYAEHRAGPHRWALGRFVAPAARLEELGRAADRCFPAAGTAMAGERTRSAPTRRLTSPLVRRFNDAYRGRAVVDAVELKAATPGAIAPRSSASGPGLEATSSYRCRRDPDAPDSAPPASAVRARRSAPAASPPTPSPRRRTCSASSANVGSSRVPFKATAGLHHPLRGSYPLTYAPVSARAPMYGFLNLFLAAAFVAQRHERRRRRCASRRKLGRAPSDSPTAPSSGAAISSASPSSARARREVADLVRLLLVPRADRRPPVARPPVIRSDRTKPTIRPDGAGSPRRTATPTFRFRTCRSACSAAGGVATARAWAWPSATRCSTSPHAPSAGF